MKQYSWFDQLVGGDWADRQRINEAAGELNLLCADQSNLTMQVQRLFQLDRDQGREIARLQLIINTLLELILKHQILPEAELTQSLSAGLEGLERQEQQERAARAVSDENRDPFYVAPKGR